MGAISLVDLAGSESVRLTGATGVRQKEGGKINQSLLDAVARRAAIGREGQGELRELSRFSPDAVIAAYSIGKSAVGHGLLRRAVVQLRRGDENRTLQFGSRAARVTLKPVVHEILDDASQLRAEWSASWPSSKNRSSTSATRRRARRKSWLIYWRRTRSSRRT